MKSIRERIRRNPKVIRVGVSVVVATMALSGMSAYNVNAENQEIESILSTIKTVQRDVGKKESVYFFTDPSGKVTKTIVSDHLINSAKEDVIKDSSTLADIENVKGDETYDGSGNSMEWQAEGADIYYQGSSTKKEPVSIKITYYLDGKETPASEMAGKSGKVTMRFDYTNNTSYTENVDGQEVTVCVPLAAVTGILLEDNFTNVEVTADVTDFSMENTLTLVENATDVTTFEGGSDFSEIDSLLGELSDASEQLESGSSELAEGIAALKESLVAFQAGMNSLNTGVTDYTNGASQLESGIHSLSSGIDQLQQGSYSLNAGAAELTGNNNALVSGASQLKDGTDQIVTGVDALQEGSQKLEAGMTQFNEDAIQRMVGSYNGDIKPLTTRLKAAVHAGKEYQTFTSLAEGTEGSVRFIYKTDAIKKSEKKAD